MKFRDRSDGANDNSGTPTLTTRIVRVGCAVTTIAAAAIAVIVVLLYPKVSKLKHEYVTQEAVEAVRQYVATHHGAWPTSWANIPNAELYQEHTKIRFDVRSGTLVEDPDAIYDWIQTITGEHHTYPNHRWEMEQLRDLILHHLDEPNSVEQKKLND